VFRRRKDCWRASWKWCSSCPHGRQSNGDTVAFCDGHAKAMKPIVLWSNQNDMLYCSPTWSGLATRD